MDCAQLLSDSGVLFRKVVDVVAQYNIPKDSIPLSIGKWAQSSLGSSSVRIKNTYSLFDLTNGMEAFVFISFIHKMTFHNKPYCSRSGLHV